MPKLRAFFRYFGAKKEAAKYYPYPRYKVLIEPFAGSAGYALTHFSREVRLYDISEYICGVWDYLIHISEKELLKLPVIGEFDHVNELEVPQEAKWFLGFWLQTGVTKPVEKPSGWSIKNAGGKRGRAEATWDERCRKIIASQLRYIRHWTIEQKSYKDVDNESATWYIDPPYHRSGKKYPGGKKMDFQHLGEWCKGRKGQVIVCEEKGADWLPFQPVKACAGLSNKSNSEVVYYQ